LEIVKMLIRENVEIFIPDGETIEEGLMRTTHLGIGAHPDDLEIMAIDGILKCFQNQKMWFSGVVVTDGSGSPKEGIYLDYSNEEMIAIRRNEQKKAALIGEYGSLVMLNHPSSSLKDNPNPEITQDLISLLKKTKPKVVYTHNLADKHSTHVGVGLRVIQAVRALDRNERPKFVFGCEVWRDLDWLEDEKKVVFDLSEHEDLQKALLGVFGSQIWGGKRYDLATMGRRKAHATYFASHGVDRATGIGFAMDLSPLIEDDHLSISNYLESYLSRFHDLVMKNIVKYE